MRGTLSQSLSHTLAQAFFFLSSRFLTFSPPRRIREHFPAFSSFQGCNCEKKGPLVSRVYIRVQAWVAPLHVFWPEQAGLSSKMSAHRSPQEAPPVLSCPVHRTGRLFVEMPFETPGDDMSQDVSYSRDHRSRTSLFRKPQEITPLVFLYAGFWTTRVHPIPPSLFTWNFV